MGPAEPAGTRELSSMLLSDEELPHRDQGDVRAALYDFLDLLYGRDLLALGVLDDFPIELQDLLAVEIPDISPFDLS